MDKGREQQYYVLVDLSACWHLAAVISGAVVKDSMIVLRLYWGTRSCSRCPGRLWPRWALQIARDLPDITEHFAQRWLLSANVRGGVTSPLPSRSTEVCGTKHDWIADDSRVDWASVREASIYLQRFITDNFGTVLPEEFHFGVGNGNCRNNRRV